MAGGVESPVGTSSRLSALLDATGFTKSLWCQSERNEESRVGFPSDKVAEAWRGAVSGVAGTWTKREFLSVKPYSTAVE